MPADSQAPAAPAAPATPADPASSASGSAAPAPSSGASQVPAAGQQATAQAEAAGADVERLRAELATATGTRIPDLQRQLADAQGNERRAREEATRNHSAWLEWAKANLPAEKWQDIERHEQERTGKVLLTQAARAEALELVNEALDSDDPDERAFGRFLKQQNQVAPLKRASLDTYRKMFTQFRGGTPAAASAAPAGGAQAATPPAPSTPATPPRVPGASGPPNGPETVWKPGMKASDLFARAFGRK